MRLSAILLLTLLAFGCSKGQQGEPGPEGPRGALGPVGATGSMGLQGVVGPTGERGDRGPVGDAGADGVDGAVGPTGPPGPTGSQGQGGPTGSQGQVGPTGLQGPIGQPGGMQVLTAGGASLGTAYGILPMSTAAFAQWIGPSILPSDTWVLLAEQPLDAGPRVLVWRNMGTGKAFGCAGAAGVDPTVYFTSADCSGTPYAAWGPPVGMACTSSWHGGRLVALQGTPDAGYSFQSVWSSGACQGSGAPLVAATPLIDFGAPGTLQGPLQFVPP
jgi:hypothetical protein